MPDEGYAGDLTPAEALQRVMGGARLVDVRSRPEWEQVGVPDTSSAGSDPVFVEWNRADGSRNQSFLEQLGGRQGEELLFICRSGVRSVAAAQSATAAGYTVYNVLHGFEADGGWRDSGLATTAYAGVEPLQPAAGDADD